jgi:hypothetical protein
MLANEVTPDMIERFKLNHDPANELETPDIPSGIAAVLSMPEVRQAIYEQVRQEAGRELPADEHHFDTSCDDRPYCGIREHHALEDFE